MSLATVLGNALAQAQKPQREGEPDRFAFVAGYMATDKRSVPWDFSVDRPTVFLLLPEGP